NRLFDQTRARLCGESFEKTGGWLPPIDIYEDERSIVVKVELPEVPLDAVTVRLAEGVLVIEGERQLERPPGRHTYHRIEGGHGPFRRALSVPVQLRAEEISVSGANGVLRIVLPRPTSAPVLPTMAAD